MIAERVLGLRAPMRFAFTDDQLALRDAVRDLLEKDCTPVHLRDAWTNATGRIPGLWDQLEAMGVIGMLAPESEGGLGLTMATSCLILEETGRFALPEPIVETAAFGVPLFGRTDIVVGTAQRFVPWADTATCSSPRRAASIPTTSSSSRTRRSMVRGACSTCAARRRRPRATFPPRITAACSATPRSCAVSAVG